MNQVNYQKELDRVLQSLEHDRASGLPAPTLFLHSCCAPCSSYVLEYLRSFFRITVFYYNPNISFREEYRKRMEEQKRLIGEYNRQKAGYEITVREGEYEPGRFFETVRGLEDCPEGKERCFRCYALRLSETAARAKKAGSDYFCTTLSISPLKNARKINEIGREMEERYGVAWLPSDFKKRDGYKRSIQLSAEYGLYRQNYCGCAFSKRENIACGTEESEV